MSHAAPSCAGFAPRQSTFGCTTQKFAMGEPRSFGHAAGAAGIDEAGIPVRSTNKNATLEVFERTMAVDGLYPNYGSISFSRPSLLLNFKEVVAPRAST